MAFIKVLSMSKIIAWLLILFLLNNNLFSYSQNSYKTQNLAPISQITNIQKEIIKNPNVLSKIIPIRMVLKAFLICILTVALLTSCLSKNTSGNVPADPKPKAGTSATMTSFEKGEIFLQENIQFNKLGFPISYYPNDNQNIADKTRSYTFDIGCLLQYTSLNQEKWKDQMRIIISSILAHNKNVLANAYNNNGIAEDKADLGPNTVIARGLLKWSEKQNDESFKEAKMIADYYLQPSNQIQTNGHFVIRHNSSDRIANPEENGRAVLLYLDLCKYYFENNNTKEANKYLNAAENILLGFISLRGPEIYPFSINEKGEAVWEAANKEGIDGQITFLQAVKYYLNVIPENRQNALIKNDLNKKETLLNWVIKTFQNKETSIIINGKNISIPFSLSKRLGNDGNAGEGQFWVEITAQFALLIQDIPGYEQTYKNAIISLKNIQNADGSFPYAPELINGYNKDLNFGNLNIPLNYPVSSLAATVEALYAINPKGIDSGLFALMGNQKVMICFAMAA